MAKFTIAELVAKFTGDTSGLENATSKAGKTIAGFAKTAATAAGVAAAAFGALALKQIDVVSKNSDLAKSLGVSYSALSNMSLIANEAGVEINALGASLVFMQRKIVEAVSGSEQAQEAFNALGLSASDLFALSPDEQFAAIAEKISLIENPALRTATAMEIFGKAGKGLVTIFEDYGIKAQDATKFNDKFNISLSEVDAAKVDEAGDAMGRIGLAMQGLATQLTVSISPALTKMSQQIIDMLPSAEKLNKFLTGGLAGVPYGSNQNIGSGIVGKYLGNSGSGVAKKAQNDADVYIKNLYDKIEKNPLLQFDKPIVEIKETTSTTSTGRGSFPFRDTKVGADTATESVTRLNGEILETIDKQTDLRNSAADTFSGFISSVNKGEDAMESLRSTALKVIDDILQNMIRLSFGGSTTGNGIGSTIATSLFDFFGGYKPSFEVGKGVPPKKPFANGGVVNGATMFPIGTNSAVMGEKGAEAIMPLTRIGGKLGVAATGGGKNVTVNNNFSLGVQQTVRAEIARMLPDITKASVGSVQDAQNRNILRGV